MRKYHYEAGVMNRHNNEAQFAFSAKMIAFVSTEDVTKGLNVLADCFPDDWQPVLDEGTQMKVDLLVATCHGSHLSRRRLVTEATWHGGHSSRRPLGSAAIWPGDYFPRSG